MKLLLRTLVLVTSMVSVPVHAHHSISKYYFEDETVSLEGKVVQFEYRSPHVWVHMIAKDSNGEIQRFAAEWCSPSRLTRDAVTKDTLKPGDFVVITGSPGRNAAERKLHLKGIERPADGWKAGTARRPGTKFPCF